MGIAKVELSDVVVIAENDYGYEFCVGRLGKIWIGCAVGTLDDGTQTVFLFDEISDDLASVGVADRELAIRMTGALADDPEQSYGGVDRWFVAAELRGKPDDFRCERCRRVGCDGRECVGAEIDVEMEQEEI